MAGTECIEVLLVLGLLFLKSGDGCGVLSLGGFKSIAHPRARTPSQSSLTGACFLLGSLDLNLKLSNLGLESRDLREVLLLFGFDLVIIGRLQGRLRRGQLINLLLQLSGRSLVAGLEISQGGLLRRRISLILLKTFLMLSFQGLDSRGLLGLKRSLELLNLGSILFDGLLECLLAGVQLFLILTPPSRSQQNQDQREASEDQSRQPGASHLPQTPGTREPHRLLAHLFGELCNLLLGGLDFRLEGLNLGLTFS
ncbi:hypothetical protein HG530_009763 [Fusarium avenaceum]|nr:hypothetical protein HG530_009763 [Fusarium avenaceum]